MCFLFFVYLFFSFLLKSVFSLLSTDRSKLVVCPVKSMSIMLLPLFLFFLASMVLSDE